MAIIFILLSTFLGYVFSIKAGWPVQLLVGFLVVVWACSNELELSAVYIALFAFGLLIGMGIGDVAFFVAHGSPDSVVETFKWLVTP